MSRRASLPFVLRRSSDRIGAEIVSTTETFHGLLHFEGDRLVIQWRVATSTDRFGKEIGTERAVGSVREATVPLAAVSGAIIRRRGILGGRACVLIASDLTAFDPIAGADALALDHPAEFVIPVRRADRILAEEFAAELALAIAERGALGALDRGPVPPAISSGTGTTP